MAKGGGGSWKVAYADFVTAMMAFFLVMWIGSQDASTRQAVANYFIDPMGADRKPGKPRSVHESPLLGPVPDEKAAKTARGAEVPTRPEGEHGPATTLVMRYLNTDEKQKKKWFDECQAVHEIALRSPQVRDGTVTIRDMKIQELAARLQATFVGGSPAKVSDIYQDLMLWSIKEVNWTEIASELVGK